MTKKEYIELLKEKMQEVKSFNVTTYKKIYHETQLINLKNLYYSLMEVNRFLFMPETHEFKQYKLNIQCKKPKKELDANLRYCLTVIKRQLQEIYRDTQNDLIQFE